MPFFIHIDAALLSLLGELPVVTRVRLQERLQCIAEAAEKWMPDDPRWEGLAQRDGDGLRTYVEGCCVRFHLRLDSRRVMVEQMGCVRVHSPTLHADL